MEFELRELNCLLMAVREKSLTKAAELLYTSQPALSRTITRMEEKAGCQLLERKSRGVELSKAGEIVFHHAQIIQAEYRQMQEELDAYLSGAQETLHAAYMGDGQFANMLRIIELFSEYCPNVTIAPIRTLPIEALYDGMADVGFSYFSEKREQYDWMERMTLCPMGLSAFVHQSHPLWEKERVSLSDLRSCRLILPTRTHAGFQVRFPTLFSEIAWFLEQRGFDPAEFSDAEGSQMFRARIVKEQFVGIMPDASYVIANERLRCIPISDCRTGFEIVMAWRKNDSNPQIQRLRRFLSGPEVQKKLRPAF